MKPDIAKHFLILLSHPAQYLFFKHTIISLKQKGYTVSILIKTKDILANLLEMDGCKFVNILPKERGKTKFHIFFSLLQRNIKLYRYCKKHKVTLLMGTDASLSHVAKLRGIPCITTLEDDYSVIKSLAKLTYPFTSVILTPLVCDVGKWSDKKIAYQGYMKLAYLHPYRFVPDFSRLKIDISKPYFLIRLSSLKAHHDFGVSGISDTLLNAIINFLKNHGNIYISSEKELPTQYKEFSLKIPVSDIHHYLYYAQLLICDSQSMAVESAVLGVPSIRVSSFSGRISVLEELEHNYLLTFGIKPENEKQILEKIKELISQENIKEIFRERRMKMLSEKIDVSSFLTWFVESYPESAKIMKENPDYQYNFK